MLYTPLLPEAASGTLEPRHVVVPLRADVPARRAPARPRDVLDDASREVVDRRDARRAVRDRRTSGSSSRSAPCTRDVPRPGPRRSTASASRTSPTRSRSATASCCSSSAPPITRTIRAELGFVFVGAGYAGVEALAELERPRARGAPLLPDAARRAAALGARRRRAEDPPRDPAAARRVRARAASSGAASRSTSGRRSSPTTARGRPLRRHARSRRARSSGRPACARTRSSRELGLPLDERGRVVVDETLRVEGRDDVWALGDCAAVPNAQDARRASIRRRASTRSGRRGGSRRTCTGAPKPYGYRMLGQVATLGRFKGIAEIPGLQLCGLPRLVRHADVPPVPAPAALAEAPRRRRLDGRALLPARHRRALDARPSAAARRLTTRSRLQRRSASSDCLPPSDCRSSTGEEIAVARDAIEHGVHRERRRVETRRDLVPAQRRRDRRARPRAHRVDATRSSCPGPFWFASTSTPRRFAFAHSVVTSPGCARASAPATIPANSRISSKRVPARDRDEHVDPARAARLREALELEQVERLLARAARPRSPPRSRRPPTGRGRTSPSRAARAVDARRPRVQVDAAHVRPSTGARARRSTSA